MATESSADAQIPSVAASAVAQPSGQTCANPQRGIGLVFPRDGGLAVQHEERKDNGDVVTEEGRLLQKYQEIWERVDATGADRPSNLTCTHGSKPEAGFSPSYGSSKGEIGHDTTTAT